MKYSSSLLRVPLNQCALRALSRVAAIFRNEKNKTILLREGTLKPKKMLLFFINKCQLNFWNQVFSDLTGEEYITDINKNWYIHARTALCCFHNIVLFPLYSNKIYLYKP